MNVLVTGHAGYIGSVMVKTLTAAGHHVRGLDAAFFDGCGFDGAGAPVVERPADVRDATVSDVRGFDAIVHLAALCNDPLGDLDPGLTAEINHRASTRLASLARDSGVSRFIFASSCSMYGAGSDGELLTESAPLRPLTPYAESKVRVEEDLDKLADRDFSPIALRNATAYGFSPRLRGDVVVNNFVGLASTTGVIRIMSDGSPWRPLVHVQDIAQACSVCLTAPRERVHNQAFNVGRNTENYQVREIAGIVQEVVPGSTVQYAGKVAPDARDYRVDFSKLPAHVPAFKPLWDVRRGAREVYQALLEAPTTAEQFQGWRFTRLAQIRRLLETGALDGNLRWSNRVVAVGVTR